MFLMADFSCISSFSAASFILEQVCLSLTKRLLFVSLQIFFLKLFSVYVKGEHIECLSCLWSWLKEQSSPSLAASQRSEEHFPSFHRNVKKWRNCQMELGAGPRETPISLFSTPRSMSLHKGKFLKKKTPESIFEITDTNKSLRKHRTEPVWKQHPHSWDRWQRTDFHDSVQGIHPPKTLFGKTDTSEYL